MGNPEPTYVPRYESPSGTQAQQELYNIYPASQHV